MIVDIANSVRAHTLVGNALAAASEGQEQAFLLTPRHILKCIKKVNRLTSPNRDELLELDGEALLRGA